MKQFIGLLLFILLVEYSFAQKVSQQDVPAVVLNAFQLKFPNAESVKWKLEKGYYIVDFKLNSKAHILTIDNKGSALKHVQDLYVSEIPKVVLETISSKVTYFDVHDADKHEINGKIEYIINFKVDGRSHHFWINENGKLLKYRIELKANDIPVSILNIIKNDYGGIDVRRVRYVEERGSNIYIIEGTINGNKHTFVFDSNTTLLRHN